jgi:hypothetical protein
VLTFANSELYALPRTRALIQVNATSAQVDVDDGLGITPRRQKPTRKGRTPLFLQ